MRRQEGKRGRWVSKHCGVPIRPDLKSPLRPSFQALPPCKPSPPALGILSGGHICSNLGAHLPPVTPAVWGAAVSPGTGSPEGAQGSPLQWTSWSAISTWGFSSDIDTLLCGCRVHGLALLFSSGPFMDTLNSFPAPLSHFPSVEEWANYGRRAQKSLDSTGTFSTWRPLDLGHF